MKTIVEKTLRAVHVNPVHPGRGQPSYIELRAVPAWLKGDAYVKAIITPAEAIRLIEQLAVSVRVTTQ